jgi:hypothetical protein
MGDCCNMYGRRQDGQLWDKIFQKFCWKSFLFKSRFRTVRHWRPDGRTSAASNFHIRLSVSGPRGMNVRTVILQHAISISAMRAFEPIEADVRTVEVESAITLTDERASGPMLTNVQTGNHIIRTFEVDLPIYWTWKESEADQSLMDVKTGCWEVRTDASWNRSFSTQCRVRTEKIRRPDGWCWSVWHPIVMNMSFGRMEQWTDGRSDGMTRRPDGW